MTRSRDTVSEKIDQLFRTVCRPDGREYTYDDVERGTEGRVSRSYVWKLRHGRNNNPSLDVIEALGQFFQVPPTYFFGPSYRDDDAAREAAQIAVLLQHPGVREVADQARGLGRQSLQATLALIESLHKIEGTRRSAQESA